MMLGSKGLLPQRQIVARPKDSARGIGPIGKVPLPIEGGDNQRLERTGSGLRKPPPESSVPGENLTGGSRRNQLRRGHGSPPVLSEVFSSLALLRTPKSANGPRSNSFRPDSSLDTLQPGTEDSDRLLHHTGPGPFRMRPPFSIKLTTDD